MSNWILDKLLDGMGKAQLLKLVWKIIGKVFKRLYWDVLALVNTAEQNMPNEDGETKARWVYDEFVKSHKDYASWDWVVNMLIETAVGDVKRYEEKV